LSQQHLVRKPQSSITRGRKPGVAISVFLRLVERAIQLDNQLGSVTAEIGDEAANRNLATEMQAMKVAQHAQPSPKPTLWRGGFITEVARKSDVDGTTYLAGRR